MKTCNVDGCNNPVWSKGMCKMHIPKTPLKKSCPIPSPKSPMEKIIEETISELFYGKEKPVVNHSLKLDKRNQLFLSVWQTRKHVCEICGKHLGNEPKSYMFDHLLEKSKYKFLEFEPLNIALVCLECHDKKTRGFINAIYQEKINFVITKFNVS